MHMFLSQLNNNKLIDTVFTPDCTRDWNHKFYSSQSTTQHKGPIICWANLHAVGLYSHCLLFSSLGGPSIMINIACIQGTIANVAEGGGGFHKNVMYQNCTPSPQVISYENSTTYPLVIIIIIICKTQPLFHLSGPSIRASSWPKPSTIISFYHDC